MADADRAVAAPSRVALIWADLQRVALGGGRLQTPELKRFAQNTSVALAFGAVVGSWSGARHSSRQFWAERVNTKSKMSVAESAHYNDAIAPRVIRESLSRGAGLAARLGVLVGTFSIIEAGTAVVRDKDDWMNGAAAGLLFGLAFGALGRFGARGALTMTAVGAACGSLYGVGNQMVARLDESLDNSKPET